MAWCLADPKIGEREVAGELLAHAARTGALRPGLILIGDKGFAGREFEDLITAGFGLRLVRPDRKNESPRPVHRLDPAVDRIGQRHPQGPARLERHGGRTTEGLYARVTAAAGHGRVHLAQLGKRRTCRAVADRLWTTGPKRNHSSRVGAQRPQVELLKAAARATPGVSQSATPWTPVVSASRISEYVP